MVKQRKYIFRLIGILFFLFCYSGLAAQSPIPGINISVNPADNPVEKDFLNIKKNIIDGYLKNRDLDFKYLNHFILFRSFTYIGWNISRINETNGHERNKKYIENTFNLIKTLEIE